MPFQWEEDKALGRWVNEQRTQNTRGILRPDRKEALEKLGFLWRINRGDGNGRVVKKPKLAKHISSDTAATTTFLADTSTAIVSSSSDDTDDNKSLQTQPRAYRKRKYRVVSDSDTDNSIAQPSSPVDVDPTLLNTDIMILHLERYKEKHGHTNVPEDYNPHQLGPWVAAMRSQCRAGMLTTLDATKLLEVGVIIRGEEEIWKDEYDKLREFGTEHGHYQVSKLDDPDLAVWTSSQRELHRSDKLRKDRKELLDKIMFDFDYREPSADMFLNDDNTVHSNDLDSTSLEGTFSLLAAAAAWVA